jgi:hypothetical protein
MFSSLISKIVTWVGSISWKTDKVLTETEIETVRGMLVDSYYIVLTRQNGHLSTYAIAIAHWIQTRRRGYYSHVLMNTEDEVRSDADFRMIEATRSGVHYSTFAQVFNGQCGSVALLKPKSLTLDHWAQIMDQAKGYLGRPYDTLFDLTSDSALSCVELIRGALRGLDDYQTRFRSFEKMVSENPKPTPQMFLECEDFEVVYEVRH